MQYSVIAIVVVTPRGISTTGNSIIVDACQASV